MTRQFSLLAPWSFLPNVLGAGSTVFSDVEGDRSSMSSIQSTSTKMTFTHVDVHTVPNKGSKSEYQNANEPWTSRQPYTRCHLNSEVGSIDTPEFSRNLTQRFANVGLVDD